MIQISAAAKRATPTNSLARREAFDPPTLSDLHDDGQHEGPPSRPFAEEAAQLDAQPFLDQPLVRAFFDARLLDDFRQQPRAVGQERLAILHDEPARDDIGHALERTRLLVDRDDRDDQPVLGQMAAVAQHLVADLAGSGVVDQHAADRRLARDPRAGLVEMEHVAVLREEDGGLRIATGEDALGDARVLRELAEFAVHRDEESRPHEGQHQLELLLAPVAGDVDVLDALVDHVGAAPRQMVDDAADRLLVAWNRPRRQHDRVVGADLHVAVIVDRDARQRRHRFALRAGGQAQHVPGGVAADLRIANLYAGGNAQVAQPLGDLGVAHHAAADEGHLAIELRREVDEDLHPVDARRKRRHDQLAGRAREDLLERLDDLQLRSGEAAAIDVRAVGEQRQHAGAAELGEPVHVEVLAVDRGLIDLEIAGVYDDAGGRMDRQRDAVRYAVRDADEFDREWADAQALPRPDRNELAAVDAVFLELRLDQGERQGCCVQRTVDQREHVRHGADVILMAVRQHERGDASFLLQVRQIRNDPVHAQQLGVRKHHPRVDDDRRLVPGEREHVHAELAESAKRYYFEHQ